MIGETKDDYATCTNTTDLCRLYENVCLENHGVVRAIRVCS